MRKMHSLDLIGERFGRWRVVSKSHVSNYGAVFWRCQCDCGEERAVAAESLRSGKSTSCGCAHREAVTRHGMTGTPTFKSWESMKQRCLNPNAPDYRHYGGRGIKVHAPWVNSFETFLSDMGLRPKGKTLDRRNVDEDYTPCNCRWATPKQQLRNRRDTVGITFNGGRKTVYEWAKATGISPRALKDRLRSGWTPERALSEPVNAKLSRRKRT